MTALLVYWRAAAAVAVISAALALILLLQHERSERREAERGRDAAKAEAASAAVQADLNQKSGTAAVRAASRAVAANARSEEAAHEILTTPGADMVLPDAVRAAWVAGVLGLREGTGAAPADPDDPLG